MRIREMRPDDVPDAAPLELEVAKRSYRDDAVLPEDHHADRLRSALDRRWDHLFVAEQDGELVGHAWLSEQTDRATDTRYGLLKSLAVRSDVEGQGVGRTLIARVEEAARDLDLERLRLIVGAGNDRAIAFYRRAGFGTQTHLMEKDL